ncbi:MAG TPA: hypothetical protein VIM33_04935 [Gaiellaceae bacterium]|jgi:endogenous inhibitor of DNA gyrase (YacG/DUF329 family)
MSTPDDKQARKQELLAELAALEHVPPEPDRTFPPVTQPHPSPVLAEAGAWQAPEHGSGGEVTAPPPTAPADPAATVEAPEGSTVSTTTFEQVASDGSTEKTTPGHSTIPCPVCGNTSVKTTNVTAAVPTNTVRGDTVNPGDQVVACDSCGTTIDKGDLEAFEANAKAGAFGESVKKTAEGGTSAADTEQAAIDQEEQTLKDRLASLEERKAKLQADAKPEEGGVKVGNSETKGGGA